MKQSDIFSKKTHTFFFILIGISFVLAAIAIVSVQAAYELKAHEHPTLSESQLNVIKFNIAQHTHKGFSPVQHLFLDKEAGNQSATIKQYIDSEVAILTKEIVENRKDIQSNHTTITPKPGSKTAGSDTPVFTFTITKTQWIAGDTITFTGTGQPGKPIQAFARIGGESLKGSTVVLETGSYVLDMKTEFSSTKGTWQVFANHMKVKSDILEFQLQ